MKMKNKKYIEIRFKLPIEDFKPYESEANKLNEKLGIKTSGTALIKRDTQIQASIKRGSF